MPESFKGKKIELTGENAAGYKEYSFSRKKDQGEIDVEEKTPMNRRHFLRGFFSTALTGAAGLGTFELSKHKSEIRGTSEEELLPPLDSLKLGELSASQESSTDTEPRESQEESETLSESKYFMQAVAEFADRYNRDVTQVLEYASKVTVNDPKNRSRIEYVQEELSIEGIPEIIAHELQKYIVGLCDVESSFNAAKKSPDGAQGPLQFMPATWKEHSADAENILSLVAQIDAAQSKFKQIYTHLIHTCGVELDAIKAEFFFGDNEHFQKEFLTPVIINSFNAGQGTLANVLTWFVHRYPTQEKTKGIFNAEEVVSGYDVFFTMAAQAYKEEVNANYRDDARAYVPKVYGATKSLENFIKV